MFFKIAEKRPLAIAGGAFLPTLFLFMNLSGSLTLWLGIVFLTLTTALAVIAIIKKKHLLPLVALLLAVCMSASVSFIFNEIYYKKRVEKYAGVHTCEFVVTSNVKNDPYYTVSEITVTSVDEEECDFRATLVSGFMAVLDENSLYKSELELTPTKKNFVIYDMYNFSKGFMMEAGCADMSSLVYLKECNDFPHSQISDIHNRLSVFFGMYLDEDEASFAKALIDGDKSDLSPSVSKSFKNLGISHMLAISGMHLSVIVGIIAFAIGKMKVRKRILGLVLLLATVFYMFLTGFTPSIVRASVMLIMTYVAFGISRNNDSITALLFSVSLICIVSAEAIFDIGLWLSFTATLGILVMGVPICEKILPKKRGIVVKAVKWLASTVIITLSAVIFTYPVVLLFFGELSAFTLPANILFSLPVTAILLLTAVMAVASPLAFLTRIVAAVLEALIGFTVKAADVIASEKFMMSTEFEFLAVVTVIAAVAVMYFLLKGKKIYALSIGCVVLALVVVTNLLYGLVMPTKRGAGYFSASGNDTVYVKNGEKICLIDNSNGGYSHISDVLKTVDGSGKGNVTLIFTHYHIYSAYAVNKLCENAMIDSLILASPSDNEINAYEAIKRAAEAHGVTVSYYTVGEDEILWQGARILVTSEKKSDSVHKNIFVSISIGNENFEYTSADFKEGKNVFEGTHTSDVENSDAREHVFIPISD